MKSEQRERERAREYPTEREREKPHHVYSVVCDQPQLDPSVRAAFIALSLSAPAGQTH